MLTAPTDLTAVRKALEAEGNRGRLLGDDDGPDYVPSRSTRARAKSLIRLMETLDDHDDVDEVHANSDIPADVLERVAG